MRPEPEVDTNIVIVNFGNHRRHLIAAQLEAINAHDPAVVGIDAQFFKLQDPFKDSLLRKAFANTKRLVLISELPKANSQNTHDSLIRSNPYFMSNAMTGFADVISESGIRTSRTFSPKEIVADSVELAFAVKVAQVFDPAKTQKFLERGNEVEYINFRGNLEKFLTVDAYDLLVDSLKHKVPSMKNKIVLMGFLGQDFEHGNEVKIDKFFTPLNEQYVGKSLPDMFGIVIHANIASMILSEQPIEVCPEWLKWLITFGLCYFIVIFCYQIRANLPDWYDTVVKLSQVAVVALILYASLMVFAYFNFHIDLFEGIVAVLLTGDLVEVYQDTIPNLLRNKLIKKNRKATIIGNVRSSSIEK